MSGADAVNLRLGSRGSTLALWQAHHVQRTLETLHEHLRIDIEVLHTTGDRITDVPLAMIGDRGLFTKEVDAAVLDGRVHFAVHSLKDVPTRLPDGLALGAVMQREDPRDAFLPAPGQSPTLQELPAGARVGTSSLRRRALLLGSRPDLHIDDLRGNLDTRFTKLRSGDYDAIILALAGVRRFGREAAVGQTLDPPGWLPAAGQGALALVCRDDDRDALELLRPVDHIDTRAATTAERAFLARLEGGCQIPIGALATVADDVLTLHGLVAAIDGSTIVRGHAAGSATEPTRIGEDLAHDLVGRGANVVLRAVRGAAVQAPVPSAP